MTRLIVLAVVLALMLGACGRNRYQPAFEVMAEPIPPRLRQLSLDKLEAIVIEAAMRGSSGWVMTKTGPGVLDGRLDVKTHQVFAKVILTQSEYSIRYDHSVNVKQHGSLIDRRANAWLKALDRDIKSAMAVAELRT